MKKLIDKIDKEKLFNILIILIVIALYITVFMFIYSSFRERKREELSKGIIEKVDEQIKKENENSNSNVDVPNEIITNYGGISYTVLGKIEIKKINIYQPILKDNTKNSYDASAVKISGPNLNEFGNVSIGGHNFMRGDFFIKINRLVKDDIISITDLSGRKVDYYVYEYAITSIDDASYLAQPVKKDEKIVTLVTCTKGGKERYFVKAKAK